MAQQKKVASTKEVPKKKWKVTVTGAAPYDTVRVYNLEKPTDDSAAQEGLRLFVLDVQQAHTIDVKGN